MSQPDEPGEAPPSRRLGSEADAWRRLWHAEQAPRLAWGAPTTAAGIAFGKRSRH